MGKKDYMTMREAMVDIESGYFMASRDYDCLRAI